MNLSILVDRILHIEEMEFCPWHLRFHVQYFCYFVVLSHHHFWLKNHGEKWSRTDYLEIPRAPSELLQKNLPRKAELARLVSRYL